MYSGPPRGAPGHPHRDKLTLKCQILIYFWDPTFFTILSPDNLHSVPPPPVSFSPDEQEGAEAFHPFGEIRSER